MITCRGGIEVVRLSIRRAQESGERITGGAASVETATEKLAVAKELLRLGKYFKAQRVAQQSLNWAEKAREFHRRVLSDFKSLEDYIYYVKKLRYDTDEAERILVDVKKAILSLDYNRALSLMDRARKVLRRATFKPFPLLNKDITIKSAVGIEQGKIIYKIKIENHSPDSLGELILQPAVNTEMFAPIREQPIGEVFSMQAKEIRFTLMPVVKNWNIGVPGALIEGKDIILKTILECKDGIATYKVMVKNLKEAPLIDIDVYPFVPKGLKSDEESKVIDEIEAYGSEVVIFDLTPGRKKGRVSRYTATYEDDFPYTWSYSMPEDYELEPDWNEESVEEDVWAEPEIVQDEWEEDEEEVEEEVEDWPEEEEEEEEVEEEEEEEEVEEEEEEEEVEEETEEWPEEEGEDIVDDELLDIETTGFKPVNNKFKNMMFMPDMIKMLEESATSNEKMSEDEDISSTETEEES